MFKRGEGECDHGDLVLGEVGVGSLSVLDHLKKTSGTK